ncbi:MAG: TolC family protein [Bryobacteraceae bacterium]
MQLTAQSDVLTLDQALQLALKHNRAIEQAELGLSEYDDAIHAAKTQKLPSFRFNSTTGMLLTRPTITFEKGAFGEYPGIGSVPGNTTSISSARKPTAMLSAEAVLPITQRRKIGLGIQQLEVNQRIAQQQTRRTRQDVIKQVRQSYYAILQSQSSLDAVEHTLALLRELSTQTTQYVKAGTALNGDLLNVKARLAQAEYDKVALAGPLATQKEQLNFLLGRPVDTEFRVSPGLARAPFRRLPRPASAPSPHALKSSSRASKSSTPSSTTARRRVSTFPMSASASATTPP